MTTEIVARLAKSGNVVDRNGATYRVLCGGQIDGRPVCGEQIADVNVRDWVRTYTGERPSPLVFSSGWIEGEDGIRRLTRHAAKARQHVHRIASGTEDGSGQATRARERLSTGSAYKYRRPIPRWVELETLLDAELPCQAQCPKCGRINDVPLTLVTEALTRWLDERDRRPS